MKTVLHSIASKLVNKRSTVRGVPYIMKSNMHMFGHRGSSTTEPENTYSSIKQALELCDGAEFDIQMTKDGQLVVLHDLTLARTAVPWSQEHGLSEAEYYSLVTTPVTQLNYDQFKDIHIGRYFTFLRNYFPKLIPILSI